MLFPLGFGFWPRVVPFAILAIVAICVGWSAAYFPVLREIEARTDKETQSNQAVAIKKLITMASKACTHKFPGNSYCSVESLTKRQSLVGMKLKQVEKIEEYLRQFEQEPGRWPAEAKAQPEFREYMKEREAASAKHLRVATESGMTTRSQSTWFHLVRATFTHHNWDHLLGNMLMLVIFGIWVEQREGSLFTGATFMMGSVLGTATQLVLTPESPILGASAGVTALMGAFFVFFRRADFNFLFMIPPVYFKKVSIPLLWIFPFLYLASDLIGASSNTSHVAHYAHLMGFSVGGLMAYIYMRMQPLPDGAFFPQELAALAKIRKTTKPEVLWAAFRDLMRWNLQNRIGLIEFLKRKRALEFPVSDEANRKVLDSALQFTAKKVLRHGSVPDMLLFLKHLPDEVPVKEFLGKGPLSLVLHLADTSAQAGNYALAFALYKCGLELTDDDYAIDLITAALKALQKLYKARSAKAA